MGVIQLLPMGRTRYRCRDCGDMVDITPLAENVRQHGLIHAREDEMGQEMYLAWKVLVLGTTEYEVKGNCVEHRIITRAME